MTTVKPLARVAVLLPAAGALAFLALASAGTFAHDSGAKPAAGPAASPSASASPSPTAPQRTYKKVGGLPVCMSGCHFLGIAVQRPAVLQDFVSATRVHPRIVQVYGRFGRPFPLSWAESMTMQGYLPQIQIDPYQTSLPAVAAGQYDSYLASYAASVKELKGPVVLSFGHEMNGQWYPWGCGHTSVADYVAAYQHVVKTIRHDGAHNVIWMWTVSALGDTACPIGAQFPGERYVTWVGVDGYMRTPGHSFPVTFGAALARLHQLTQRPILISETGVLVDTPRAARRITSLYRNAAATPGVIGVVYFDSQTEKFGDYKPQDNAAALAAFKRATSRYVAGR